MISITKQAEAYLEALAEALEISPSRYEQAERSYKSLGEWLHRVDSKVAKYSPEVYVQGSFRLGTVTKPQTTDEEYDVDSVCVLTDLSKSQLSQFQLKELLGNEIKSYRRSKGIEKPVSESRRCWRLDYADGAQFHMDIVPGLPNANDQRRLLAASNLDFQFSATALAITDNEVPQFNEITEDWPRSNPHGYAEWFKVRMGDIFIKRREQVLGEMRSNNVTASVEEIPTYRVRTPLQSAIMILKRHRDSMFADDLTNAPISIIISTLSAHAYDGEESIGHALMSILSRMDQWIERDNQKYIIRNPTDGLENFADKWEEFPERATAFFNWLRQAQSDFATAATSADNRQMSKVLAARMGSSAVDQARENVMKAAQSGGTLLSGAVAASTAGVPNVSFPDTARTPKKPDGFA